MPLIALLIAFLSKMDKQVYIVLKEYEVLNAPAAEKNTYKMSTIFLVRQSLKGLEKCSRHIVDLQGSLCFILRHTQPLAGYVFTDKLYSSRIAFMLLQKVLHSFLEETEDQWKSIQKDTNITIPIIKKLFQLYQNPAKIDKTLLALEKVNETKAIMHENIRKLLQRQHSLEELVQKSKDLPETAKKYYRVTKQMNGRCCQIF